MSNLVPQLKRERLPYLDYARVFVMYLVIFGHLLLNDDTTIRPYIYSFHMPFFFLVSGMLHKDRGGIAWNKYWKTLIVPFLLFNFLFFILWPLCWKIGIWGPSSKFDSSSGFISIYLCFFKQLLINFLYGKAPADGPTWFLVALLWCKVLTDCLCRNRWRAIILITILAIVGAILLFGFNHRTFLRINNALMVLPFFYGGFKYKEQIQQWCSKRWALIFGVVLLLLNIPCTLVNGKISTDAVRFGQLATPVCALVFYFNAFSCSLGLLAICMQFPAKKYVTISARALITILCMQNFFCYTYRHLCDQTNISLITVTSALIFIACVLIHQLLEKYFPFTIGK